MLLVVSGCASSGRKPVDDTSPLSTPPPIIGRNEPGRPDVDPAVSTASATAPAPAPVAAEPKDAPDSAPAASEGVRADPVDPPATWDPKIEPAGCPTCGGRAGISANPAPNPSCTTCGGTGCSPGSAACYPFPATTHLGRFVGGLYECLCCPDPCYQPSWVPESNASFFLDYARPRTITRFRVDEALDMNFPDRNEFFWARDDGKGKGPSLPKSMSSSSSSSNSTTKAAKTTSTAQTATAVSPLGRPPGVSGSAAGRAAGNPAGRPPNLVVTTTPAPHATHTAVHHTLKGQPGLTSYQQLYFYQEAAAGNGSFFVEMPYRSVDPDIGPRKSGFGDVNLGTKALLFDCELLQIAFQFRTYLPSGQSVKGLGTGHTTLEPGLLASLRLGPTTSLQGQIAEWIPIAGDPNYSGALLRYGLSLNQVLYRFTPNSPLIGTLEYQGISFQDGLYTDPLLGATKSSGSSYASLGPGLRAVVCDKVDFGLGTNFTLTDHNFFHQLYRFEVRFLY